MQRSVDLPSHYATFPSDSRSQLCGGRHWWEWVLLIVGFSNVGVLLGLSAVDMSHAVDQNTNLTSLQKLSFGGQLSVLPIPLIEITDMNPAFTFDLAMVLTSVITSALIVYGIFAEKKYDLCICPLILSVAVMFCLTEYLVNTDDNRPIKLTRLVICATLALISIPLTVRTVNEKYWTEFQISGASDGLMGMYRRLKFFNALIKLDLFFSVLLGTFSLIYGLNSTGLQLGLFLCFLIYGLLCLIVAGFAVNLEVKLLVFAFVVISMFLPLFIPFQLMSFQCILIPIIPCSGMKKLVVSCAIAAAILAITLRTYILLVLLQVYRHFGYGLTDAAFAGLIANESTSLLGRRGRRY